MLVFSNMNAPVPISSTMIGTEKVTMIRGAERKKPYVSCIRVNGVPILPPLMDQRTKSMAIEAKNRALQLEMQLGWTLRYREQGCAEMVAGRSRGETGSLSTQNSTGDRRDKGVHKFSTRCICGGKERPHVSRRFTSVPCLSDGSPNAVFWRAQVESSSLVRSLILPSLRSSGSVKLLRKCSSAESLQVGEQCENKSSSECPRCGRVGQLDRESGSGTLPSEQLRAGNSKARSPAKGRDWNRSQIAYVKGGGTASVESELSLVSVSPQKYCQSRESDNSDSTWAAGFYKQLFPLQNGENRNFEYDSSDEDLERQLPEPGSSARDSRSTSSDYVSARESGVALLDVPTNSGTDDGQSGGYRLVRQGSYVLEKPSDVLLEHLKRQSTGVADIGLQRLARPTKEMSVQTGIDDFELSDDEDDELLETGSKVTLLREKLRKRFDAAMEALLVKQRAEQEALARAFLQVQQSARLQMKASAVINAAARGYLVRRLMKTKHVQDLIETMEESLKCIFELKGESLRPLRADQELYDRLLQQEFPKIVPFFSGESFWKASCLNVYVLLPSRFGCRSNRWHCLTAACTTFYETFFEISTAERMKIIAADRERLKYLQLKAASLGLHSTRLVVGVDIIQDWGQHTALGKTILSNSPPTFLVVHGDESTIFQEALDELH